MKKISIIVATVLLGSMAKAEIMNSVCTTAKGTQLLLTYDNWTDNGPKLISLTIGGKDMRPQLLNNRFGTTGGKPTFTLSNFPQQGKSAYFSIYGAGSKYIVGSETIPLDCSTKPAEEKPAKSDDDNSF